MHKLIKKERRRPIVIALKDKLNNMPATQRECFAEKCGTSFDNLRQIAYGWGGCSVTKAKLIVAACDGEIELGDLIPELKYQHA